MKLSKAFLEFIEKEDNEKGDILLAMVEEPENTRDDITEVAIDFIINSSEYDGNVLEMRRYVATNILEDDEEDPDDDVEDDDELTTLEILAQDIDIDEDEDALWEDDEDDDDL